MPKSSNSPSVFQIMRLFFRKTEGLTLEQKKQVADQLKKDLEDKKHA